MVVGWRTRGGGEEVETEVDDVSSSQASCASQVETHHLQPTHAAAVASNNLAR